MHRALRAVSLLAALSLATSSGAASGPVEGSQAKPTPAFQRAKSPAQSAAVKQRIAENLKTLDANLADVKENLATTKANLKTLHDELEELDSLEKEHTQLKKKYETYLTTSRAELKKGTDKLASLTEREKALALKAGGDEKAKSELGAVRVEKQQHEKWAAETQTKVAKTEKLMIDLLKNLRDIQARREPLKGQMQSWSEREKEYERLQGELGAKKAQLEKVANQ